MNISSCSPSSSLSSSTWLVSMYSLRWRTANTCRNPETASSSLLLARVSWFLTQGPCKYSRKRKRWRDREQESEKGKVMHHDSLTYAEYRRMGSLSWTVCAGHSCKPTGTILSGGHIIFSLSLTHTKHKTTHMHTQVSLKQHIYIMRHTCMYSVRVLKTCLATVKAFSRLSLPSRSMVSCSE